MFSPPIMLKWHVHEVQFFDMLKYLIVIRDMAQIHHDLDELALHPVIYLGPF